MNHEPDARDDLQDPQLAKWYREGGGPEPSAALDQAILAAARREVHARPYAAGALVRRWRVPLSLAAVLVLSVTVVTLVHEREDELAPVGAPPRPAEHAARVPEPPRSERAPAQSVEPKPAAPDVAGAPPPPPAIVPTPAISPAAAPAPVAPASPGRAAEQGTTLKDASRERATGGPAPAEPFPRAAGPPAATTGSLSAAAPRVAPGPASAEFGEREDARRAAGAKDDLAQGSSPAATKAEAQDQAATAPASAAPAANPAPAAPTVASPTGVARQESAVAESRAMARMQASRQPTPPSGEVAQLVKALDAQPPERWLEKIEELRRVGRHGESDELLAEFKKRFPNHPGAATR